MICTKRARLTPMIAAEPLRKKSRGRLKIILIELTT